MIETKKVIVTIGLGRELGLEGMQLRGLGLLDGVCFLDEFLEV